MSNLRLTLLLLAVILLAAVSCREDEGLDVLALVCLAVVVGGAVCMLSRLIRGEV